MKSFWNRLLLSLICYLFFSLRVFAAQVEPCRIIPDGVKRHSFLQCSSGEMSLSILGGQETTWTGVFHLELTKNLFNSTRTIHIQSSSGHPEDIAQIVVEKDRIQPGLSFSHVNITFFRPNTIWVLDGLSRIRADIEDLTIDSIDSRGTVVIQDAIQVNSKLQIHGERVFIQTPFSVRKGTFELVYAQGGLNRLNYPFETQINQGLIQVRSVGRVQTPTQRRPNFEPFLESRIEISFDEFSEAFQRATQTSLLARFPDLHHLGPDYARIGYLRNEVPRRLSNQEKGELGEMLFKLYMEKYKPSYRYEDSKIGPHSFDAVFNSVRRNPVSQELQGDLMIAEVKFSNSASAELGTREIHGMHWRQLSGPYNQSVLTEMGQSSEHRLRRLSRRIKKLKDRVKLKLAVFNSSDSTLSIYNLGTFDEPRLN
ncbi:MAG: hypothetical protein ACO3A2_02380 [Bdellovibrionia bacterium]